MTRFTTWDRPKDVLPLKNVSPTYKAAIEWVPVASEDVMNVHAPDASVHEPRLVPASENKTWPVGVLPATAPPCGATAAVKLTCRPISDGFSKDVTVVVLPARATT